jgi:cystathionine beta-lyase/cystathionine gamma-synthase
MSILMPFRLPLFKPSNFAFDSVDDLRKAFEDEMGGYIYSRGLNPTVEILRKKLAALDGAEDCLVFNNGSAATFAAVLANVKSGDHIVSIDHPIVGQGICLTKYFQDLGVTTTYIDGRYIENFERAILPHTSLIYLESPTSWYFELQDLKAVAELAKAEGIVTLIDNSYCTPLYQRPIELGIDMVMQTATKYISGHSDTLGGCYQAQKK